MTFSGISSVMAFSTEKQREFYVTTEAQQYDRISGIHNL